MEKNVQNIGILNYILTVVFGKNNKILGILGENNEVIESNFIITLGMRAIIITGLDSITGSRVPVIALKWRKIGSDKHQDFPSLIYGIRMGFIRTFIDADGRKWEHCILPEEEMLFYYNLNKKIKYVFKLR